MTHYLPTPATTFLQQQLPTPNQQPPTCSGNYQSCTSSYQSCTSGYQSCTSDHLPAPATTSPAPVTTSPDYQRLPDLHQQSSPAPATRSCTNYQFLDCTIFQLRFTIIKFGLSKQPPCCHFCLVRCQSLIF